MDIAAELKVFQHQFRQYLLPKTYSCKIKKYNTYINSEKERLNVVNSCIDLL